MTAKPLPSRTRSRICAVSILTPCGLAGAARRGGRRRRICRRRLLLRVLAYRAQAAVFGDLDKATARLLDRIADDAGSGKRVEVPVPDRVGIRPGTLLVREWEGVSHRVMVMAEGFAWNGSTYPSLSKVARAITGTRWNGPRFFGLRDQKGSGR